VARSWVEFSHLVFRMSANVKPSMPRLVDVGLKLSDKRLHVDADHIAVAVALYNIKVII